jgi:hypothetical protein
MLILRWRRSLLLGAAVLAAAAAAALWVVTASGGAVDNLPSDKMTVTGSQLESAAPGQDVTLLGPVQMRTSTPEDLVLQVSAECSLLTGLTTTGNETADSQGQVQVWVEVDGKKVAVVPGPPSSTTTDDQSKVTFCNRAYHRTTSGFGPTESIDDYINTKAANAFNWVTVNVGNGIHTIAVKGDLTATATNGTAEAKIGNRTLVVQPTTYAQNP